MKTTNLLRIAATATAFMAAVLVLCLTDNSVPFHETVVNNNMSYGILIVLIVATIAISNLIKSAEEIEEKELINEIKNMFK